MSGRLGKRLTSLEGRLVAKRKAVGRNLEHTYSDAALAALLGGEISRAQFLVADAYDQGPRRRLQDLTNAELKALIGDDEDPGDSADLSHLSDEDLDALIASYPKPTEAERQAILRKLGSPPDWSRLADAELLAIMASEDLKP